MLLYVYTYTRITPKMLNAKCQPMIVFDLDDTLYKERDYVASGRRAVARYIDEHGLDADVDGVWTPEMLQAYRTHTPRLRLDADTRSTLAALKKAGVTMGIITDGRVVSQSAKYEALGLSEFVHPADLLICSHPNADKTTSRPFIEMASAHTGEPYFVYVGDNPAKDFEQPNRLGWLTVMLRDHDGVNIHPQTMPDEAVRRPLLRIDRLSQLLTLLPHFPD